MELNVLYEENCLDTMSRMPDDFIDLTVTSPPYEDLRDYENSLEWNFEIFKLVAEQLYRVTKKGGVVVWIVNDKVKNGSESGVSFKQALYFKEVGFNLHDTMIYKKINYVPLTHNRYEQSFEYMFILSKGKPKTFNPIMVPCKNVGKLEKYGNGRRKNYGKNHSMRLYDNTEYIATKSHKISPNIFEYTLGKDKTGHPAPFPEKLSEDHILSWSNENDIVYDPFAGSGTTMKMSVLNNRNCIGSEKVKKYCKIIKDRINSI